MDVGPVPTGLTIVHLANKNDEPRDVSRSGTRRRRLDRLAELEEERIETDKGTVLYAAGGFVGFIILLLVAAWSSGLLTQP